MQNTGSAWILGGAVGLLVLTPLVAAGEEHFDRSPVDCVSTSRIRQAKVIDDQTLMFHMHGGKYYRNTLQYKCPGLKRAKRFSYEIRTSRLCDVDTITVLESFGLGLSRGATCRLGEFFPITEVEAQDLVTGPEGVTARQNAIDVKEVKLPPEDAEDEAPADTAPPSDADSPPDAASDSRD
jgi:hypothetical protein